MLAPLGALLLSLLSPACGDDSSSAASTSMSSGSGGAGGAGGAGGSGGSGGSGGVGGSMQAPALVVEKINDPTWELVDFHQMSNAVGTQFELAQDLLQQVLPPPDHALHPDLGIGPGQTHNGPYASEIGQAFLQNGWEEKTTFTIAEASLPNAILGTWMVVPSASAPVGSSPDFVSGPILPNVIFPIQVDMQIFVDGAPLQDGHYMFDVPALDAALDPPFDVDGHSHFPMFGFYILDGEVDLTGVRETRGSMVDATGAGWNLSFAFTTTE